MMYICYYLLATATVECQNLVIGVLSAHLPKQPALGEWWWTTPSVGVDAAVRVRVQQHRVGLPEDAFHESVETDASICRSHQGNDNVVLVMGPDEFALVLIRDREQIGRQRLNGAHLQLWVVQNGVQLYGAVGDQVTRQIAAECPSTPFGIGA